MKLRILAFIILSVPFLLTSCLENDGISSQKRLAKDLELIDQYLQANNITALKDATGVRFTIDSLGSGHTPRYNSTVTFDYTGKLLSGAVFQTSTLKNINIATLVSGFQIGLPLIPNGSKATLYIPSVYAYGPQAQSGIPANSCLIFQIKLKSITVTAAEKNQLKADTIMIDELLVNTSVNAVKDSSGLRYVITQIGTGPNPSWFDKVKISYTGYLITNGAKGAKFYEGINEPSQTSDSRVVNYIRGFQVGLQKLPKGSKATFFVPSGLGFGNQAVSGGIITVPANSSLIYDIELLDILNP
jgi:FKBP-type peptidyl-prolyl cis-trans isomerase